MAAGDVRGELPHNSRKRLDTLLEELDGLEALRTKVERALHARRWARDQEGGVKSEAEAALASGDQVTALALNLRSMQILHRLVEHVRDRHSNHNERADAEMGAVGL